MYSYITKELPALLQNVPELDVSRVRPSTYNICWHHITVLQASITGHSMGGHGALVLGLRHPELYRSISAFAPICNPMDVPWGRKGPGFGWSCTMCMHVPTPKTAFGGYLGDNTSQWEAYDACALAKEYTGPMRHLLIDTGTADSFLEVQLKPERLAQVVAGNCALTIDNRLQEGYDHSYFFIATFVDDHVDHAAKHLC